MGLLDDAIREHLDLKRARGGDPAEIERMEREALGPVRREPTYGATRFPDDEPSGPPRRVVYPEDAEYPGYHDSTAPHDDLRLDSEHGRRHPRDDQGYGADPGHDAPVFGYAEEERPAPRRRFLRRHRQGPPPDARPQRGVFDEEPGDEFRQPNPYHEDPYPYHEDPHESWTHPDEAHAHGDLARQHAEEPWHDHPEPPYAEPATSHPDALAEPPHDPPPPEDPVTQMMPAAEPPPLEFDRPPKRPRFTPEPPSLHRLEEPPAGEPTDSEPTTGETPPLPPGDERAGHAPEAQETTEFDVASHIAETRQPPDESTAEAPAEEDVLEETPEFLQDTPEHDRLWFEQRPPRDFDF